MVLMYVLTSLKLHPRKYGGSGNTLCTSLTFVYISLFIYLLERYGKTLNPYRNPEGNHHILWLLKSDISNGDGPLELTP